MIQATALSQYLPVVPEWGHPLITPEGKTIRVPAFAFRKLSQLGALLGKSNRLSTKIYQIIQPEFDCITEGLGHLLGEDLNGPSWILCTCKDCQRRVAESDHTALPGRNHLDKARAEEIVREIVRKRKYS
ncbi:MAG: hypothetical protein JXB23_12985 [Candidatus Aminicenantes bacterium]|nr:hypothetical protein [Candidatus Aminicenantes bacterium]